MAAHICDDYYLSANSDNYILYHYETRESIRLGKQRTGEFKEFHDVIGYYTSIKGVIEGCIRHATRNKLINEQFESLDDVLDFLSAFEQRLIDATHDY